MSGDTRQEYTACVLNLDELRRVVSGILKRGYSLFHDFHEYESPCLVMLDTLDRPILWANGLQRVPCQFENDQDFLSFCDRIATAAGLSSQPRSQPQGFADIEPEHIRQFRLSPVV